MVGVGLGLGFRVLGLGFRGNSSIAVIVHFYVALNITIIIDCDWVRAVPQSWGWFAGPMVLM